MKYKIIAEILDGTICATKSNITCFVSNSLHDQNGDRIDPQIGEILPKKSTDQAETFWSYSKKEWEKLNKGFVKIQKK